MTQPLGAEPTCFCSPEDGLLPAMISTFDPAGVDLRDICDTHPVADQGFTPDSTDLSVIALNFTTEAEISTFVVPTSQFGSCNFLDIEEGGVQDAITVPEAWRCIRELAAACRGLGY